MSGEIMVCLGYAAGHHCDHVGQFLREFDPDYANGLGRAWWTPDAAKAKRFTNHGELFEFWRQVSKVQPKRGDGKPNRPLTAYNITNSTIAGLGDPSLAAMIEAARAIR